MSEKKRYRIYGHGASDAVVLYDLLSDKGNAPEIWYRSAWDQPQSAKGLHLGMLFQALAPTAVMPFQFEGTPEEALQALRRDVAVYRIESCLAFIAFNDVSVEDAVADLQEQEIGSLLAQSEIIGRVRELGFIPLILQAVRTDRGEVGEKHLREILQRSGVKALEELFFTQT